jgi:maltose phosphorylase
MHRFLKVDPWQLIEEGFEPANVRAAESLFSLGNGRMGGRGNFEEHYSGDSLPGSYFAGVFYPDKTRVGWWKVGYPEYFAKMINSVNWIGIDVEVDGQPLDLARCSVPSFRRVLDMQAAALRRSFVARLASGRRVSVEAERFISMADPEVAAIRYAVTPLDGEATLRVTPYLDGDVANEDANYGERFWSEVKRKARPPLGCLQVRTRKQEVHVASGMNVDLERNGRPTVARFTPSESASYVGLTCELRVPRGKECTLYKYVGNATSLDHAPEDVSAAACRAAERARARGFAGLLADHRAAWAAKWKASDVRIDGDLEAQQAIRFNIFQLHQTYTGEDPRLNIGPKGFTGEKYGGGTYWDTEAFCLPFYLATAPSLVARNLLLYRYRHLDKAIENARKLGFSGGAALYPMVTVSGEECHNEWEITFEEVHRNGAMAYAIWNYVRHTGDRSYLVEHGLEVLIALARFWSQRATFSQARQKYVILGVTGPNEYENNVNNNWYTNFIARWTLSYTLEVLALVRSLAPETCGALLARLSFDEAAEGRRFRDIIERLHLPRIEGTEVFLQQDGYLDKELLTVSAIPPAERPINRHWSWDRILRSCFIKQADVLQGLYLFLDDFPLEVVRANFGFYEPRTVHESSLSASVHAVLAAHLGEVEKAYELFLRASRLDLDDDNHEVAEGLHVTSMAGAWLAIVEGFAGKRIRGDRLSFAPILPARWEAYAFTLRWREQLIELTVARQTLTLANHGSVQIDLTIDERPVTIGAGDELTIARLPYDDAGDSEAV